MIKQGKNEAKMGECVIPYCFAPKAALEGFQGLKMAKNRLDLRYLTQEQGSDKQL